MHEPMTVFGSECKKSYTQVQLTGRIQH